MLRNRPLNILSLFILSTVVFGFIGCGHYHKFMSQKAIAQVKPTKGRQTQGVVHFERVDRHKTKIKAIIRGLPKNQKFGFHIHEFGDCSSKDGKSAGGHFNPLNHKHGMADSSEKHLGDLGNLESNEKGIAFYEKTFDHMSLQHPGYGIIGRAIIVHGKPDDGGQPTGNAGHRVACGVIGITTNN